jgi:N-acetylmuramoyl-L-alanine amidase
MRVAISIGHYPESPGAKSASGKDEHALVAPVAGFLIRYLHEAGVEAHLVPTGRLGAKVDWVNRGSGVAFDLALELHGNADPDEDGHGSPVADGCETLYCTGSVSGERYAESIQSVMARRLGARDRGAKAARFYWLRKTVCPAVIVEPVFIDSAQGEEIISSNPAAVADAISRGVLASIHPGG